MLQLKLNAEENILLGSTSNGFVVWNVSNNKNGRTDNQELLNKKENSDDKPEKTDEQEKAFVLSLPHGVRNISTKILESNSIMLDSSKKYAVAGVRYC